jgi:hypothetical protein
VVTWFSMENIKGVIITGQQIGAGWSPALSVAKALAALAEAKRRGLRPVYWLADEDHDHLEVASVVALEGARLIRRRFKFSAPAGTATGWLEWTGAHQAEAQNLWGHLPDPVEPTLRGHVLALGKPLWSRGIKSFSPTKDADRAAVQPELERWRAMGLEKALHSQADYLESSGEKLILDPRQQSAWFSLNPKTGERCRLESGQPCPKGCWLSPGAALRPLMQSLLLPVEAVVLGPGERAYWKLLERVWDSVGLNAPEILPRPTIFVIPDGASELSPEELEPLRLGQWDALAPALTMKPSAMPFPKPIESWGNAITKRYSAEMGRLQTRLERLDARLARDAAEKRLGANIEKLRQELFPFNKPQERVIPGWHWLQKPALLDAMENAMEKPAGVYVIKENQLQNPEKLTGDN